MPVVVRHEPSRQLRGFLNYMTALQAQDRQNRLIEQERSMRANQATSNAIANQFVQAQQRQAQKERDERLASNRMDLQELIGAQGMERAQLADRSATSRLQTQLGAALERQTNQLNALRERQDAQQTFMGEQYGQNRELRRELERNQASAQRQRDFFKTFNTSPQKVVDTVLAAPSHVPGNIPYANPKPPDASLGPPQYIQQPESVAWVDKLQRDLALAEEAGVTLGLDTTIPPDQQAAMLNALWPKVQGLRSQIAQYYERHPRPDNRPDNGIVGPDGKMGKMHIGPNYLDPQKPWLGGIVVSQKSDGSWDFTQMQTPKSHTEYLSDQQRWNEGASWLDGLRKNGRDVEFAKAILGDDYIDSGGDYYWDLMNRTPVPFENKAKVAQASRIQKLQEQNDKDYYALMQKEVENWRRNNGDEKTGGPHYGNIPLSGWRVIDRNTRNNAQMLGFKVPDRVPDWTTFRDTAIPDDMDVVDQGMFNEAVDLLSEFWGNNPSPTFTSRADDFMNRFYREYHMGGKKVPAGLAARKSDVAKAMAQGRFMNQMYENRGSWTPDHVRWGVSADDTGPHYPTKPIKTITEPNDLPPGMRASPLKPGF